MTVREQTWEIEDRLLSPRAQRAAQTQGRAYPLEECPIRTCYQRDRDRIVHSKAYRRLMHKTQVFLLPEGDHYRTRLTHTQEVSQIARTIARALRLNEDLTEAAALGHDLGHTPFGHAGERALAQVHPGGFVHSKQSLRVVDILEREGAGLNLTYEVRDGIENHSSNAMPFTLEGQVVRLSDKIAYLNHDFDDAVRAGVLRDSDFPPMLGKALGHSGSDRISTMITSIVQCGTDCIRMEKEVGDAFTKLRAFMFERVYLNPDVKSEENKAMDIVRWLYTYFTESPDKMPAEYRRILETEGIARAVCDYVAGMSDRYAISVFEDLFIPKSWNI